MSSPRRQRVSSSSTNLQGDFRVEVMGSQESLDLDCGKFYTEYILRCSWVARNGTPEIWDVVRRYREFCAIDILVSWKHFINTFQGTKRQLTTYAMSVVAMKLREKYPSRALMFPYLPSKKYIGSSLSADFVDKRQRDLGYYMVSILHSFPLLVQDEIMDSFLDIKRHILERAREECNDRCSAFTHTHSEEQ